MPAVSYCGRNFLSVHVLLIYIYYCRCCFSDIEKAADKITNQKALM